MSLLSYFARQSPVTDPGIASSRLAELPVDVATLRQVARGLVLHYRADNPSAYGIPEDRLCEVDSRYAARMFGRLFELDERSLTEERPPEARLLGCCRDFTVLFLAMARQHGIPARARVGFASYFIPGFNVDHEIAEVWDPAEERWRLVDPELADEHVDATDGTTFDALDIPRDRFLVGGAAWKACRAGDADPATFVVHPDLDLEVTRSWPYLVHNLIHDLAALNKVEMILWDAWGLMMNDRLDSETLALLDQVARTTLSGDAGFAEVEALYANEAGLQVPATVLSYSPVSEAPREVKLDTQVSAF